MLTESLQIVMVLVGLLLLAKKIAEMEENHHLRVVFLTVLLSCIALYLITLVSCGPVFHVVDCPAGHYCGADHY